MSNKQARLISAVADAMLSQGFSQSNLARTSGVAQSMISAALLGKYDLKEEKWRLMCEALALDYDDIIAEPDVLTESACTDKETPWPMRRPSRGIWPARQSRWQRLCAKCGRPSWS